MYTASTWRRVTAHIVDQIVVAIFFTPIWIQVVGSLLQKGEIHIPYRWMIVGFLLQFAYRWLFLYFMGATLGKLMMGLRVVSFPDEGPLTLMQSLIRVLTDGLSLFFNEGLRVLGLIRFDRRHVADWVAETQVRQRHPREHPPRPRWVLAVILCVYFSLTGFLSAYSLFQRSIWEHDGVVLHLRDVNADGLESGH